MPSAPAPFVVSVHRSAAHDFSKSIADEIMLLPGLGVAGDAHSGATVQHLYDKRRDPNRPNLRQIHLIQSELLEEVRLEGFEVAPGELGENISTSGLDILSLPAGTRLLIGEQAIIEVTGLRNPCFKIDRLRKGLLAQMGGRPSKGGYRSKAGVMGIVVQGGPVRANDRIEVRLPAGEHVPLKAI